MDNRENSDSLKKLFRSLSLKTQLLLLLLFLLVITIGSMTIIYARTEHTLLAKMTEDIEEIMNAIRVSMEEVVYTSNATEKLKSYVDMLNKKGINEISILSDATDDVSEVIASSNPRRIGTKAKISRKKDFIITAKLGEESKDEPQKLYNVILPVTAKGQNVGYIHISLILDDYRMIQKRNHLKRILSTLFAFSIGIILCIVLAEKYTDPIKKIAKASKKIAQGQLVKIDNQKRKDEIGVLMESFNEMVDKMSEQKALEEKLKKTEQLSIIGQLASGIAHEIRNPLNFLLLSIGHVKEKIAESTLPDKEELAALLNSSVNEIHKMNELIHNFLLLGKPITLNREWINQKSLVEETILILRDKIKGGIRLAVSFEDERQEIYCDREYVRICILNLLINAIQAVNGEGSIQLACGRDEGFSFILVSDTGSGIKEEDMHRIFEPYFSTKASGFGLGLSLTKRFVEEHGGTIKIDSKIGQGTTIMIRIPYYETQ